MNVEIRFYDKHGDSTGDLYAQAFEVAPRVGEILNLDGVESVIFSAWHLLTQDHAGNYSYQYQIAAKPPES